MPAGPFERQVHADSRALWVLEATTDNVILVDREFRITFINGHTSRLNNITPEGVLGRTIWEQWPGNVGTDIERNYRHAMATGEPVKFVHGYFEEDRFDLWLEIHAFPSDEGLAIFFRDISDSKRQAAQEREEQLRLHRAIEATDLGVWRVNLPFDGTPFYLSPQVRRHMGISENEPIAMPEFVALLHPDDVQKTTLAITRAIEERVPYDVLYRTIGRDGNCRWLRASGNAFYREDGTAYQFDGYTLDMTDRVKLEDRLRAALAASGAERSRLIALFDKSPTAVAILVGEDLRFEYTNGVYRRLFTQGRNFGGLKLADVLPEAAEQGFDSLLRGVMATGVPFFDPETSFTMRAHDGDAGRTVWVDFVYQPIEEPDGTISGVFAHIVDITDQVLARAKIEELAETLRRQTDLWDAALSHIADYVWVFDPEARFKYANRALLDLWGLPLEAVLGKTCEGLNYPPEVAAQLHDNTARVISTRLPVADEVDYTSPTGHTGHFEYVLHPVFGLDGQVEAAAGSSRDVAARNAAVNALRSSEERTKLQLRLLEAQRVTDSPVAMMQTSAEAIGGALKVDRVGFFEVIDDESVDLCCCWTNGVLSPVEGRATMAIIGDGALADVRAGRTVAVSDVSTSESPESAALEHIGSRSLIGAPIFRGGSWVAGMYVNDAGPRSWTEDDVNLVRRVADQTWDSVERARAEASLREANRTLEERVAERTEQLQAAIRELEAFNYSIAHDLRSPLRAMASTSSIVLEEAGPKLTDDLRALLVRQKENSVKLGRLIDELLRLSRFARAPVRRESLDMTSLSRSVFGDLQEQGRSGVCTLEVDEGMVGTGDAGLVRTVLHNLIGNACKFSPNGGVIRARQRGDVFSIADQGIGFDMAFAPKVFAPFERLVSEAQFEGTGIGLANVERIVRRHGGTVWVESEPNKGTTFFFTLGTT